MRRLSNPERSPSRDRLDSPEIASSSLAEDRKMASVYGNAGIPVYWIVNLVDRQVEVDWNPRSSRFQFLLNQPSHYDRFAQIIP